MIIRSVHILAADIVARIVHLIAQWVAVELGGLPDVAGLATRKMDWSPIVHRKSTDGAIAE